MIEQNEPAQLRFLEETANRLRQNGFTVEPIEDHHLPVRWEKGRLCRIAGKGSVLYRRENVDNIRAQDALQAVIDTAKMTSEYMAILEYAPQLKATDLTGDYRILADFGDAVLAGHPTERGVQFVTWEWDFDRKGVHHGHYFQEDYGVVYDSGMKLEQVYDGRFFPCYYYEPNAITVAVTSKAEPEDTEHITWLFLPMVQEEIDRALLRGGITDPSEIRLSLEDSWLPHEVLDLLDMNHVDISELNALVQALDEFSDMSIRKYAAAAVMARPHTAEQAKHLAENLDLFDFAPSASTPEEYGKYMIQKSGRFDYDENLDAFYDYEKYGTERMNEEDGMFTDRGYIAYKGYISMEEVMNGGQSNHMVMGGLSQ